ncbi:MULTISPECIES: hypothetical protein [Streptomyces]|uniref:hypothetical protein n=1 Tax=Streptomyces TaxID=1883 RepID=UPI001C0ED3D5|nr:hypothetical protein [Streptomyces kasugaensis]
MSKRAFSSPDAYVWRLVYKRAKFPHPNKPVRWVAARYFGMFNPFRQDTWMRKRAVTGDAGNGKPDEPATSHLIQTYCRRRPATGPGR